jgi:acetate kinase
VEKLVPIAPLHLPHNLARDPGRAGARAELPQVACFDTAMHRTCFPRLEQMFQLPKELEDAGVRRYGLHGLSYEYIASALPDYDPRAARGKTVVLHLGSGASMCALDGGRSIASTMSFTGLDGLPMGTRSGALDPGVMLYLMNSGMDARAIETLVRVGPARVSAGVRRRPLLASSERAPRSRRPVPTDRPRLARSAAPRPGRNRVPGGIGGFAVRAHDAPGGAAWLGA